MKMKCTRLMSMAALVCLALASCKKNDSMSSPSQNLSDDVLNTVNLVDLGMDEATSSEDLDDDDDATVSGSATGNSVVSGGEVSNAGAVTCRTITFSDPQKNYPYTTTHDFGTGCELVPGLVISGKKVYQKKANWRTAANGTLVTTLAYSNYRKNGLLVTGSRSSYIESGSGTANIVFRIVISETYRDVDGNTSTFVAELYRKIISGGETKTTKDDFYQYTGQVVGAEIHVPASLSQVSGWKTVIDPNNVVNKSAVCSFRQSGILKVDVIYTDSTVEHQKLDYGSGDCDNRATLTVGQDAPKNVTLPMVFFNSRL